MKNRPSLKEHYGGKLPLIRDQSQDPWVSGQVLWDSVIPAPMVIISLLLALYSILTIYCVLNTNHWKRDIEMLKVHYGEKSPLIKDQSRGPQVSGRVLWGPVIPVPVVITSLLLSLYSTLTIYCVPTLYECDA